jgi:hypothetical protein
MDEKTVLKVAGIIEKYVSYINGWRVEDSTLHEDCQHAAKEIIKYLRRKKRSK